MAKIVRMISKFRPEEKVTIDGVTMTRAMWEKYAL